MADDLRKVRSGDPLRIPARAYNAFVDAAVDYKRRQRTVASGDLVDSRQHGIVPVRNDSGRDIDRFNVLAIDGPLFEPADGGEHVFHNRIALKGIVPTDETPAGQYVITREPIPDGQIGLAVVHGVTPVRLLVEDESHAFANLAPDETVLKSSGVGGTAILWKEESTGEKWAVVEIGRPPVDHIVAILGEATLIEGERFRWRYPWREARIDGDPGSATFGRYVAIENGLSSQGDEGGEDPAKAAFNRYESHLGERPEEDPEGTDGFGGLRSLFVPGELDPTDPAGYCPSKAAVPLIKPIMKGVAVELAAERDTRGRTVWAFEALNGVELTEFEVPRWLYV